MKVNKKIIDAAILKWGVEIQTTVAVEEMAELIKEVSKVKRGEPNALQIAEELADVYITLEYIKYLHNTSDNLIQEFINKKIDKLEKRLK